MGDYGVGQVDAILETHGVGSCVTICLYNAEKKLGMMAHSMLPSAGGEPEPTAGRAKYVDQAIDNMLKDFEMRGVSHQDLTAKIVGGAKIFSIFSKEGGSIGERNILMAEKKLTERGIRLLKEDVGGTCGRSVTFNTRNGLVDVSVKI